MLYVHFMPSLVTKEDLKGSTAVVIDLLRASSTICASLVAGAREIIPFVEIEHARQEVQQARERGEEVILGGEFHGKPIEGFDLGNSPPEYTSELVSGKPIFFRSTNGMKALDHAKDANEVLIASSVNLTAVCNRLLELDDLHVLCSGTEGYVTREDILIAGALCERLQFLRAGNLPPMNDSALVAMDAWHKVTGSVNQPGSGDFSWPTVTAFAEVLKETHGGRNLVRLGRAADLPWCSQFDLFDIVPIYNAATGRIHAAMDQ